MGLGSFFSGLFTRRGKALARYHDGMAKASKKNYAGAIVDYTAAIQGDKIPPDVKAMAMYNRSLAYSALKEEGKAAADLDAVLAMPRLPQNIKTLALQRRQRLHKRNEPADEEAQ